MVEDFVPRSSTCMINRSKTVKDKTREGAVEHHDLSFYENRGLVRNPYATKNASRRRSDFSNHPLRPIDNANIKAEPEPTPRSLILISHRTPGMVTVRICTNIV